MVERLFLSRRNLLTLLSKLDRVAAGDNSRCTIIKNDNTHPKYAQSMETCVITAVEDDEYYSDRDAGETHPEDEPK